MDTNLTIGMPIFQDDDLAKMIRLHTHINQLSSRKLEPEDQNMVHEVLKSSKIYLCDDNRVITLAVRNLLLRVFEIKDIDQKLLKRALKIDFLLNPPKPSNICKLLKKREQNYIRISIDDFKRTCVIQNVKDSNYKVTLFKQKHKLPQEVDVHDSLMDFDVQGSHAVSLSSNMRITLWNIETEMSEWEPIDLKTKNSAPYKIKIVGNSIFYQNVKLIDDDDDDVIPELSADPLENEMAKMRVIDIKTGRVKYSFKLETDETLFIGNKIFCLLLNGDIAEWDMDREFKECNLIKLEKSSEIHLPTFVGSEDYLVLFDDGIFHIHNRQKNCSTKIPASTLTDKKISTIHLDGIHLLCGLEATDNYNGPIFFVIDLDRGAIINQYKIPDKAIIRVAEDEPEYEVSEFATHKGKAYVGCLSGELATFNLTKKKITLFGHHHATSDLIIDEQILFSVSRIGLRDGLKVKAWDMKSMDLVAKMKFPFAKLTFASGKIYIADEERILLLDFFTAMKNKS